MTVVRKIEIHDTRGHVKFTFDSAGLPERPVIMHRCSNCASDEVITNKDAGDLAAWLIGEAVDDAHGNGVIGINAWEQDGIIMACTLPACKQVNERVKFDHVHDLR
jgi:hypothetical protein